MGYNYSLVMSLLKPELRILAREHGVDFDREILPNLTPDDYQFICDAFYGDKWTELWNFIISKGAVV